MYLISEEDFGRGRADSGSGQPSQVDSTSAVRLKLQEAVFI
jgi:hypothetical protein